MNQISYLDSHVDAMHQLPQEGGGIDLLILSTSSLNQAHYWEERIAAQTKRLIHKDAIVIGVFEEWPNGAGNALGTLFALNRASKILKSRIGKTLIEYLNEGKSIAVYHTAGKGKRLSPLTGCEYNNKPAVELPAFHQNDQTHQPLSVLEMVVKQTAIFGKAHQGRVLVFWSDQLFVPSTLQNSPPSSHVALFAKWTKIESSKEWFAQGLSSYGLVHKDSKGHTHLADKIPETLFQEFEKEGHIDPKKGLGVSLGSFSLSKEITEILLEEYKNAVENRTGQLDTDPDWWMPMTWDQLPFLRLMEQKKRPLEKSLKQFETMKKISNDRRLNSKPLFDIYDMGEKCVWWDLGTIANYFKVNKMLLEKNEEADLLRKLFHLRPVKNNLGENLSLDDSSLLINCKIAAGSVLNSILVDVQADMAHFDNAIVVRGGFKNVQGKECLLYHVWDLDQHESIFKPKSVRADCFILKGQNRHSFLTSIDRDGVKDWEERLHMNPMSYSELDASHKDVSLKDAKAKIRALFS